MWPNDILTTLLDIDAPIIQAPMILQKPLVPLAAAVSNAGALGSLGCAEMSLDELEKRVAEMRLATDRPFNLNFFLHDEPKFDTERDAVVRRLVTPLYDQLGLKPPVEVEASTLGAFGADMLSLLETLRPAMVSFHFGCPADDVIDRLKAAGIVTAATATCVSEAEQLEQAGLDIIVAQGWEAGGHRGSFTINYEDVGIGTMALVPQVVDAVSIPVVAAGGIGDGRGIAAAFALGAAGVWMGTSFLSCPKPPSPLSIVTPC